MSRRRDFPRMNLISDCRTIPVSRSRALKESPLSAIAFLRANVSGCFIAVSMYKKVHRESAGVNLFLWSLMRQA